MFPRVFTLLLLAACAKPATSPANAEIDTLRARVAQLEQELAEAQPVRPLPASLDAIYPPQSPDPQLLFGMYAISDHMVGIGLALQSGQPEAAMAEYDKFVSAFEHIGELVPEWSGAFVASNVAPLGEALQSGDPEAVGAAFGQIGQMCSGCHQNTMVRVHHAYHWGDFRNINVDLPDGESISWHDLMSSLIALAPPAGTTHPRSA